VLPPHCRTVPAGAQLCCGCVLRQIMVARLSLKQRLLDVMSESEPPVVTEAYCTYERSTRARARRRSLTRTSTHDRTQTQAPTPFARTEVQVRRYLALDSIFGLVHALASLAVSFSPAATTASTKSVRRSCRLHLPMPCRLGARRPCKCTRELGEACAGGGAGEREALPQRHGRGDLARCTRLAHARYLQSALGRRSATGVRARAYSCVCVACVCVCPRARIVRRTCYRRN
jgi:hypothetical protein